MTARPYKHRCATTMACGASVHRAVNQAFGLLPILSAAENVEGEVAEELVAAS